MNNIISSGSFESISEEWLRTNDSSIDWELLSRNRATLSNGTTFLPARTGSNVLKPNITPDTWYVKRLDGISGLSEIEFSIWSISSTNYNNPSIKQITTIDVWSEYFYNEWSLSSVVDRASTQIINNFTYTQSSFILKTNPSSYIPTIWVMAKSKVIDGVNELTTEVALDDWAISIPQTTSTYTKHEGIWKPTDKYVRENGVWKPSETRIKHGGLWKEV